MVAEGGTPVAAEVNSQITWDPAREKAQSYCLVVALKGHHGLGKCELHT